MYALPVAHPFPVNTDRCQENPVAESTFASQDNDAQTLTPVSLQNTRITAFLYSTFSQVFSCSSPRLWVVAYSVIKASTYPVPRRTSDRDHCVFSTGGTSEGGRATSALVAFRRFNRFSPSTCMQFRPATWPAILLPLLSQYIICIAWRQPRHE